MRKTIVLLLVASLAAVSCRGVRYHDGTGSSILLADSEDADGSKSSWRLYAGPGRGNAPRIDVTRSSVTERPRVGLSVSAVTRQRAEEGGIEPWHGVWVDSVDAKGPAGRAGIVAGDLILRVGGDDVSSAEQFADLIRTRGVPGEPLDLTLRVYRRPGDPLNGASTASVEVVPDVARDRHSSTESIELDYSPAMQTYTGMQVASIPINVTEAYGGSSKVIAVTGVVVGSPAYRAGFRIGDRVTECDGVPVNDLDVLRRALMLRIRDRGWPLEDLARVDAGPNPDTVNVMTLVVEGPLGPHESTLRVDRDMRKVTDIDVPILFEYRRTIDSKRVSFLDFIFQFGFNYWRNTRASATRESVEAWELSLFPLGMFEVEKEPGSTHWTLFWLIEFDVDE